MLGDQLNQTLLFGSKARKEDDSDSDIDTLIIVNEESWQLRSTINKIGSHISLEYNVLIGPIVISQDR